MLPLTPIVRQSAGNSDLYASSRTLYGLACDGKAPAIFRKCTKNGLPIYCLAITAAFGLLAYMNVSSSSSTVFNYLSNLSSITGLITWGCINFSYLRFYYGCKKQGIDRREFPYVAPLQPYASYFGLVLILLVSLEPCPTPADIHSLTSIARRAPAIRQVIFFNGYTLFLTGNWSTTDFVIDYITVVIFIVFYCELSPTRAAPSLADPAPHLPRRLLEVLEAQQVCPPFDHGL